MHKPFKLTTLMDVIDDISSRRRQVNQPYLLLIFTIIFLTLLDMFLQSFSSKGAVLPSIAADAVMDALNNPTRHDSTDSLAAVGAMSDVKTTRNGVVGNGASSSNRSIGSIGSIGSGNSNGLFAGKKILVVDDAISILKLMTQTLKNKAEAIVTQAKDGQQAVEECEKQQFDLILTDIQMPVLDGFGEAKCIRAMEKERGLPRQIIVGISANSQVTYFTRCD